MTDPIVIEIQETQTVAVSATGPQGPAGIGVPTGGTSGQALLKNSGTNFDTSWGKPLVNTVNSWTRQQYYSIVGLTVNGDFSIDWNWNTQPEAFVAVTHGNTYLLNEPSGRQPGVKTLRVYQDSSGGGIFTFDPAYILDASLASLTFGANTFLDLYFKDDVSNVVVFGAEYSFI